MGERALAACPVHGDDLVCYSSQWAGSESAIRSVFDATGGEHPATRLTVYDWQYQTRHSWSAAVETLDYLQFETVYRLSGDGVSVYLPVWLGFGPGERTDPADGLLVRVRSAAEYTHLTATIRRLKSGLGEAVECGCLSVDVAQQILRDCVAGWQWVVPGSVTPGTAGHM